MEEPFYAVIKLKTGEELVAQVSYATEDGLLTLQDPMVVEPMQQKKGRQQIEGFILRDWIYASYDDFFFISLEDVLTMSELDENIKNFYINTVENKSAPTNIPDDTRIDMGTYGDSGARQFLPDLSEKGYLGSVQAMKQLLEELYKKS